MARRYHPRKYRDYRRRKQKITSEGTKPKRDNVCAYCGNGFTHLPHRCKYCGELYCSDHLIPENHECKLLPQGVWPPPGPGPVGPLPPPLPPPPPPGGVKNINRWQNLGNVLFFVGVITIWVAFILPFIDTTIVLDYYQMWQAGIVFVSGGTFAIVSGWMLKKRHFGFRYRFYRDRVTKRHLKIISVCTIFTVSAFLVTNIILVPLSESLIPYFENDAYTNSTTTQSTSVTTGSLERTPIGYYDAAKSYVSSHYHLDTGKTIDDLASFLNQIELHSYVEDLFDCSESSCMLEWLLEGAGYETEIANTSFSELFPHMWVLVKLDNRHDVAIEATSLTIGGYYAPPGIVDTSDGQYTTYTSDYLMFLQWKEQYPPDIYDYDPNITFEEWQKQYLMWVPSLGIPSVETYYNPPNIYSNLEELTANQWNYYIPISECDWWNVAPYNSIEPFSTWD